MTFYRDLLVRIARRTLASALLVLISPFVHAVGYDADPDNVGTTLFATGVNQLRQPELRDGRPKSMSAAEIIYWSAKENNVNPLLLIVKMQHEKDLLEPSFSDSEWQTRLNGATGFTAFDRLNGGLTLRGFFPQLVAASFQFDKWRSSYATFDAGFRLYSTDVKANATVKAIYAQYAPTFGRIVGYNYSASPAGNGFGYYNDFRDASIAPHHIQSFLETFSTKLKDRALFGTAQSVPVPPLNPDLAILAYATLPATGDISHYDACSPQCVEFVKANSDLRGSFGNARNYASNSLPGFDSLQNNGSKTKPKAGDILVWSATPGNAVYGHVALVKSVNMSSGELVRVAANETSPWCHVSESTMRIVGNATSGYTITSSNGWVFSGWRPRLTLVPLTAPPHDPNVIPLSERKTREEFINALVGRFPTAQGQSVLEKATQLGVIISGQLSNASAPISRLETGIFLARLLERLKPALWMGTLVLPFPDEIASLADKQSIGKLRRLAVFGGDYSQESNGLLFFPNRMASQSEIETVLSRVQAIVGVVPPPQPSDGMRLVSEDPLDDASFTGGAQVNKRWTLSNTGTTPWTSAFCLRPVAGGVALGSAVKCISGTVVPGGSQALTVPMVMPASLAAAQTVRQTWRLSNAQGSPVGQDVWAQFQIKGLSNSFVVEPFSLPAALRANLDNWAGTVNLNQPVNQLLMTLVDQQGSSIAVPWVAASGTRWTMQYIFLRAGTYRWTLDVRSASGTDQRTGTVVVSAAPPVALSPQLTKTDTVQALTPWSASLRTAAPVYSADLVFRTGRRIPFDGGPTQWATRNENSSFTDAGFFEYELQLRRTASSAVEVFAGFVLEVKARQVVANPPSVTSPSTTVQGSPYNLTVQTAAPADKVTVRWPDQADDQALQPMNAARTQWQYGNRLFMQLAPQTYVVRTFTDSAAAPTGELSASLQVTLPGASMRLLDISRNIVKGEQPYFSVEASLAVTRVTVQLGSQPPVNLAGNGPNGAVQGFRAQVPAVQAGAVPYSIVGYNAQGQAALAPITGTVQVAEVGDSLSAANPVPAELPRGQAVAWQFTTKSGPDQMWMEFAAPIGTLALTGRFLNHTFTYPAGDYGYRLMRKDYLGNVFPIQGAAGTLRIKNPVELTPLPTAQQAQASPNPVTAGQVVQFSAQLSSAKDVAKLELLMPSVGQLQVVQALTMQQTGASTWGLSLGLGTAGTVNVPLKVTMADGRTATLGTLTVNVADAPPRLAPKVNPAGVKVGQPMVFSVAVSNPALVARVDLVFPDANVTEPMTQVAADTWSRTRNMVQAGANRPVQMRVTLKSGAQLIGSATFSVVP